MQLAAVSAAEQSGDGMKALDLLRDLSEHVPDGDEDDKVLVQVLMGDVQYKVRVMTTGHEVCSWGFGGVPLKCVAHRLTATMLGGAKPGTSNILLVIAACAQ